MKKNHPFGSGAESFLAATFLLVILWLVYWAEHLFRYDFAQLGVLPRTIEGLKGIILMPFIHAKTEIQHIVNNSFPTFLLVSALFYFYRDVALKVLTYGWILTGFLLWLIAENKGAYHIGISGLIYMLVGFLFVSGVLRRFLPLQAISLFVVFLYGSLIWGVFPMEERVSWEGHLSGFIVGIVLAFNYRKQGPQRPKYQYEIEKEMGIEPPDYEAEYNELLRQQRELEEQQKDTENQFKIIYHYSTKHQEDKPKDETQQ